jgi:TonB-linked outer membrane protein, SusC/RagA family/TonB-dependent outer membrane receptor, SusC/RagA subfamily, signature region
VQHLQDVIVVAYGTSTKSSFTGSASVLNAETIEKTISTNVTSALSGTTPGVQVITSSGDPASSSNTIRIRGIGSISASNAPLIILDGMPYEGSISDINSSDVESMSVLKDASASAIYGARGANGVILITTKKAAGEKLPNIKFEARWGSNSRLVPQYKVIESPAEYYETYFKMLYNSQLYIGKSEAESYAFANKNIYDENNGGLGYQIYTIPAGENLIGTDFKINPKAVMGYSDGEYYYQADNWYDEAFHNSFRQEYNVSLSGTTSKLSYFGSLGYLDDGGVVNNSNYKRYTSRINTEYRAKKWLKFIANLSYSYTNSKTPSYSGDTFGSSGNIFYICNNIAPIYPLYVRDAEGNIMMDNGRIVYDSNQTNFRRPGFVGNAVRDNEYNKRQNYSDVVNGKWGFIITPIKGLSLTANLGVFSANSRYNSLSSQFGSSSSVGGSVYVSHSRTFSINTQYLAEYKTNFNNSKNNLDILVGYEQYDLKYQFLSGYNERLFDPYIGELNNAGATLPKQANSYTNKYLTQGILSRAQYDYDQRYFISASYRRDASSRFAKNHRWGNFGSIGAAWAITAENFMKNVTWVDLLKFKASWGVQGNDNLGGYYPYSDQYTHSYNEETGNFSVALSYKGNEDLTWESSHSINIGFDYELLDRRINGSIEWFNRITSDLLYYKPVPLSSGNPTGEYPINVGSISNMGVEFIVDGNIMRRENVNWNVNLNLTSYRNKIRSLDKSIPEEGIKGSSSIRKVGGSLYDAYLRKYAGVDKETGEALYYYRIKDEDGNPTGEIGTTKVFTEADQFDLGTVLPKVFGGFGTTLSAYGVDFSIQCSFQLGGEYYDGSYQALMHTQSSPGQNIHKDLLKAWTPENRNTNCPRLDGNTLVGQSAVDRFLISSNYLSINTIQIGYNFPKRLLSKTRIASLRVYLAGDNLCLLTARKGIDPRYSFGIGSYTSGSGLNTGGYSNMRNITGGISLTF